MGWKGTVRSIAAASRAAQRDSQRRHKQRLKEQMYAHSADAVDQWEAYLEDLVSVHTDLVKAIDWEEISSRQPPNAPVFEPLHKTKAEAALLSFKPSVFHFLKGGSKKVKENLAKNLNEATPKDENEYKRRSAQHLLDLQEWEEDKYLADMLLQGQKAAIRKVVEEMSSDLTNDSLLGKSIKFSIEDNFVHAQPHVHSDDIVPVVRRKQLASGKLSETKMPAGQFNELYQDYVSSVAIRCAGDLFQVLPLSEVYVTCYVDMLNLSSGHMENTPILSVKFVKSTFLSLNLQSLDPSEALRKFKHNVSFSKSKGFSRIESLIAHDEQRLAS